MLRLKEKERKELSLIRQEGPLPSAVSSFFDSVNTCVVRSLLVREMFTTENRFFSSQKQLMPALELIYRATRHDYRIRPIGSSS